MSHFYATQSKNEQSKFRNRFEWFKRLRQMSKVTFVTGIIICGSPFIIFEDLAIVLIYGVPNTLLFAFWAYYLYMSVGIPFIFFYIICKYLILKVRILNNRIAELTKNQRMSRIKNILRAFDSTYRELKQYNSMYWSKLLFIIWFVLGSGVVFHIYVVLFEPISLEIRLVLIYGTLTQCWFYLFTILTASSVTHENKKTYKIMNSFYLKMSSSTDLSKRNKFKLCYKVNNSH